MAGRGTEIVHALLALAGPGDRELVAGQCARRRGSEDIGRHGLPTTVDGRDAELDLGDRFLQGARSIRRTAPVADIPSGNAGVSRSGSDSVSTASVSSTSRYSASLSCPTESASPKLTFGRGENPR